MKIKIFILVFIFISECFWIFYPNHTIDPELVSFNSYFIDEVNKYCNKSQYFFPSKTSITLDKLPDEMLGLCKQGLFKFNVIINIKFWYMSDIDSRFSTVIHELTHAYLNQRHSDNPLNFMYKEENSLPIDIVKKQLTELLKEKCNR